MKEEESREIQIKLCQQPKCPDQLWEKTFLQLRFVAACSLVQQSIQGYKCGKRKYSKGRKAARSFWLDEKLNTQFDFWLKKPSTVLMSAFWFLRSVTYESGFQVVSQTKSKNEIPMNSAGSKANPADNCIISGMHMHSVAANIKILEELLNGNFL